MGYDSDHIYRLCISTQNKVIRTSHVTFNEDHISYVHPHAFSFSSCNSDGSDDDSDSEYITLNADHFNLDYPADLGEISPLDLYAPTCGRVDDGRRNIEDDLQDTELSHDDHDHYYDAKDQSQPQQEIQLPQLRGQTRFKQDFENMSFINSLPAQQQQQRQFKPTQPYSSSSTSYLKRKIKRTEKGKQ